MITNIFDVLKQRPQIFAKCIGVQIYRQREG